MNKIHQSKTTTLDTTNIVATYRPLAITIEVQDDLEMEPLKEYAPSRSQSREINFNLVNYEELDRYNAEWHWSQFIEFLLYHIIFQIMLGPFMVIFLFKWPGITLLKNMRFYFICDRLFLFQTLLWMGQVVGGLLYFVVEDSIINLTEVLFMWVAILFRSVVISAKYASMSPERVDLYKRFELPDEMFKFDLMFADWVKQSPKTLFLEQYRAMRRREFESTIYKLDFLLSPMTKTREGINCTEVCYYMEWALKQPIQATMPECDNIFNGFHVFGFLVNQYQQAYPYIVIYKYGITLAVILSISPVIIKIPEYIEQPLSALDIVRTLFNVLNCIQAFAGALIFFGIGLYDFNRKFFLLDQCLYMLQAKKVKYSYKKLLPTINFNNPKSLQAWSMLRSISFDYGQMYNLRTQSFYSLVFIVIVILLFVSFGVIMDIDTPTTFQLILISELAAVLMGYTVVYLIHGASLNEYFAQFETLLEDQKSVYLDISKMKQQYFELNIKPVNKVHRIFVSTIKGNVKVEEIQKYIEEIVSEIDDTIRQLNYDRRNHPFKLYGVPITFNILKSAGMFLFTVYSYAFQQRFIKK